MVKTKIKEWRYFEEKNPLEIWKDADIPYFDESFGQHRATLTPYLVPEQGRGSVIVLPGGGYQIKAWHEAEPVALMLNQHGINAFILDYRVRPYDASAPIADVQRAIRYLKFHHNKYNLLEDKIGVLGFSAGGHLAGCAMTMWEDQVYQPVDEVDAISARPDVAMLCYAVLSVADEYSLSVKTRELIDADAALLRKLSPVHRVSPKCPPAFLWHTANDETVPVQNSLEMALALGRSGVGYELHIFPEGPHGLGVAAAYPEVAIWSKLCADYLKRLEF